MPNLVRPTTTTTLLLISLFQLLSGFERFRNEHCLTIWDINHNPLSSSSPTQSLGTTTTVLPSTLNGSSILTTEESKRVDLMMHKQQQQLWKPAFESGMNEQCHSLTWFKPNERLFAAATSPSQHTTRTIRIYDPRGPLNNLLLRWKSEIFSLAFSSSVLSIPSKAPFNLCADTAERYLAASIEVNHLSSLFVVIFVVLRKVFMSTTLVRRTNR